MDLREKELKVDVDLESGGLSSGQDSCNDHVSANGTFNRVWSGVLFFDGLGRGVSDINSSTNSFSFNGSESKNVELLIERSSAEYPEHTALVDNNCAEGKQKKTNVRKPSKPPRPPKGPTLDLADQKLVREIAELAMRKRARTKRMQALKKMKASKPSSSSNSLYALIITVLFCLVIIFQGISSKSSGSRMTDGSPAPAIASSSESLVSVQIYKKFSNE